LEQAGSSVEQGGRAKGLSRHGTKQTGGKLQAGKRTKGENQAAVGVEVEADQAAGAGECRSD